jgi:hypothetical protein
MRIPRAWTVVDQVLQLRVGTEVRVDVLEVVGW